MNKYEEWVQSGMQYKVHFTIINRGNAQAPAGHDAALSIDGIEIGRKEIGVSLAPGQSYSDVFNATANLTGGIDKVKVTADISNEVAEIYETNNAYENTLAWPPAPDLVVISKREMWLPGSTTQYNVSYSVRNIGNAVAPAGHHVQLKVDGTEIEVVAIPVALDPGSVYVSSWASAPVLTMSGNSDTIAVTADVYNEVAESDETNNSRTNTWSALKPDLTITEKHEEWVVPGVSYRVFFTIKNQGTATAVAGHATVLLVDGFDYGPKPVPVPLAPGENYTDNFTTVINLSGGSDTIFVAADASNMVDESNETNNSRTNTWPLKPDLTIIEKHEVWVQNGVSYIVSYTIKNNGSTTAPAGHDMALQVDGQYIEFKPVPVSLAPGANYTDNFTTPINLSGSYDSVTVIADFNNEVDESSETNNRYGNTIAWPAAPDLKMLFFVFL